MLCHRSKPKCTDMQKQAGREDGGYESKVGSKQSVGSLTFARIRSPVISARGGRGAAKENIWAKMKNISAQFTKRVFLTFRGDR